MIDNIGREVHDMIKHWLSTPEGHYLGSGYGNPIKDVLQLSLNDGTADRIIRKLRQDIPILQGLPSDQVNLYATDNGVDIMRVFLEVGNFVTEVRSADQARFY